MKRIRNIQASHLNQIGVISAFNNFVKMRDLFNSIGEKRLKVAHYELRSNTVQKYFKMLKYIVFNSDLKFDVRT